MIYSKRLYRRKRYPTGLVSDHAQPSKIKSRYIDRTPLRYFPVTRAEVRETQDCTVLLSGMSCTVAAGEVSVISRNEPTEALKNKKAVIHPRQIANAPDMGFPSCYGGWIDPFESVNQREFGSSRIERKKKTYEYY